MSSVPISSLCLDAGTQSRAEMLQATVDEYAEAMAAGDKFPPIDVFDDGQRKIVADGFYRVAANQKNGTAEIECYVHKGSLDDAKWFAAGANRGHGMRRSNEDKATAIKLALSLPEGAKKSNLQLAKHCGVNDKTVAKYRQELETSSEIPKCSTRTGSDGIERKVSSDTRSEAAQERVATEQETMVSKLKGAARTAWDNGELNLAQAKKMADLEPVLQIDELKAIRAKAAKGAGKQKTKPAAKIEEPEKEEKKPEKPTKLLDGLKKPVPEKLRPAFERVDEVAALVRELQGVKAKAEALNDVIGFHLHFQSFAADIDNAKRALKFATPYTICGYCKASDKKQSACKACNGSGWLPKNKFQAQPGENKE